MNIFEECCNLTQDEYWKEVFRLCSQGNYPQGMYYDQTKKSVTIKKARMKLETFNLPGDPREVFMIMLRIFREKLNMKSDRDLKIDQEDIQKIKLAKAGILNCEWSKIKPKSVRETLILNYVHKMKVKYGLENEETKRLSSLISIGFQFRNLLPKDVVYSNGEITHINGIIFDVDEREFYFKNSSISSPKNDKINTTNKLISNIDKFVKDYKSKKLKL